VTLPANKTLQAVNYTAAVTILTSEGNKTQEDCEKPLVVAPADKCPYNPDLPVDHEDCKPKCDIPGKEDLFKDDPNCTLDGFSLVLSKSAVNDTQGGIDATSTTAAGRDVITFTITATNSGGTAGRFDIVDVLLDAIEYADLTDHGGGQYDTNSHTLTWKDVALEPGETTTRSFTITVKDPVPSSAQGASDPASYDCVITNAANASSGVSNNVSVRVACPPTKTVVEQTIVKQLPATGAGTNIVFGGIVAAVVVFFYARSRQLGKEVRLVRKEFNAGTL
jgi:hypothetical protein